MAQKTVLDLVGRKVSKAVDRYLALHDVLQSSTAHATCGSAAYSSCDGIGVRLRLR